jgi:hypothetical protein
VAVLGTVGEPSSSAPRRERRSDRMETKYHIAIATHHCAACAVEIAAGAYHYSAVYFDERAESFGRRDFCLACWRGDPECTLRREQPVAEDAEPKDGRGAEAPETTSETGSTEPGPIAGGELHGTTDAASSTYYAYWRAHRAPPSSGSQRRLHFDVHLALDFFRRLSESEPDFARESSSATTKPVESASDKETGAGPAAAPDDDGVFIDAPGSADGAEFSEEREPEIGQPSPPTPDGAPSSEARARDLRTNESNSDPARSELAARQKRDLRYFLALLLIRKKLLVFEGSGSRNGREWLQLIEKADPSQMYEVENPELSDDELERVRDNLGELLQMNV